jgi:gluconate 2-dehydrogenase gamma chain
MQNQLNRRDFLKTIGALGAVSVLPVGVEARPQGVPLSPAQMPDFLLPEQELKALGPLKEAYTFFTPLEVAFIEAAVARLIPADELGPGALEAGVVYFIDRQLQGAFGTMAKNYRQGPWGEGTPEQGYQLPLTPQQLYRLGIEATNRYCQETYNQSFDQLSPEQQDKVLKGLEKDILLLEDIPVKAFFDLLYDNTVEGFFADPAYGGNRDKIGWKLVGFPGVNAHYGDLIEQYYNQPYQVEPVSIADVQQGKVQLEGHAGSESR